MKTLFLIVALTLTGCSGAGEGVPVEATGSLRHGQPAERPQILRYSDKHEAYLVELDRNNSNIIIILENNESKPVYVPGNLLAGLTNKEPALKLRITNVKGAELRRCGVFEVSPNQLESIRVSSSETRRFEVPILKIREIYCTDEFIVQALVVLVRPRNVREVLAKSNSLVVRKNR